MRRNQILIWLLVVGLFALSVGAVLLTPSGREMVGGASPKPAGGTGRMAGGETPLVPPVKGFAEGQEVLFLHTEASDPQVADRLTKMMGSQILVVPSLRQAPEAMLATVYVFTNGVTGKGPFGFQPDVFDHPPGTDGYRPLRAVYLVTWKDEQAARVLRSAADVRQAQGHGEMTVEWPGAVVNMPFLAWPGGQR